MSLSFALLALGLSAAASGRALNKKGMTWSPCLELNKNLTGLFEGKALVEPLECGTISVPLDYTNPDSEPLQLDLFRVKATKEPVLGTVLYNTGGPGGEGINLAKDASDLRANVGEQYHLLSWDPRGTGYTIPFVCPEAAGVDESTEQSQKRDVGSLISRNLTQTFMEQWELRGEIADACFARSNKTGSLIGTAFVARDMLEIVDALCEDGLLRYYGWSYGTALGSYFAAMFPERVERMVLDANIDPHVYRDGHYGDNLRDTDATFAGFLDACFENKDECALATFVDANSTQDLLDALNEYIESLSTSIEEEELFAVLSLTKQMILQKLYYPALYPSLAQELVMTLNTSLEDLASEFAPEEEADTEATPWTYGQSDGTAGIGIRGADATWIVNSAEEYLPQVKFQANVSSFAEAWYTTAWTVAQWKMPAKERYYGDFKATTKHPILYVNGEYDPVTPLAHAKRASKGFEGSVLLTHSGFGHGLFADPSTCAQKHTRAYFKEGVLPEPDTHCEPDLGIWQLAEARKGMSLGALPSS